MSFDVARDVLHRVLTLCRSAKRPRGPAAPPEMRFSRFSRARACLAPPLASRTPGPFSRFSFLDPAFRRHRYVEHITTLASLFHVLWFRFRCLRSVCSIGVLYTSHERYAVGERGESKQRFSPLVAMRETVPSMNGWCARSFVVAHHQNCHDWNQCRSCYDATTLPDDVWSGGAEHLVCTVHASSWSYGN